MDEGVIDPTDDKDEPSLAVASIVARYELKADKGKNKA